MTRGVTFSSSLAAMTECIGAGESTVTAGFTLAGESTVTAGFILDEE